MGDPSQDFTNVAPGDDGRFDLDFGPNTIPAADDSLQPQPIVFSDSVLHILLESDGTACANLSGTILSPIQLSLTPDKNICRFVAMSSTSQSLPTLPDSEFAPGSCP